MPSILHRASGFSRLRGPLKQALESKLGAPLGRLQEYRKNSDCKGKEGSGPGNVLARFRTEDAKRIENEAKTNNQTVSEWVRRTLLAAIGA